MRNKLLLFTASCTFMVAGPGWAADAPALPSKAEVERLIVEGQTFLGAQAQPSGAFVPGAKFVLGITELAVDALTQQPLGFTGDEPRIKAAVQFILKFKQDDGGIYAPEEGLGNYCTSLGVLALKGAGAADAATLEGAQKYLLGIQNMDPKSPAFGGIGYGSKGAGHEDLSNTSYAIQALKASGLASDQANMKAALSFLDRCQNLSGTNKLPWAGNDGGAVYAPDESKAGGSWEPNKSAGAAAEEPARMVSYGSMTYALISSYLVLDLKPDDQRIQAALGWAKNNYQFDVNPGMVKAKERQGLFYYYGSLAKTYDLLNQGPFTLADGKVVDWRADLFAAIKTRAKTAPAGGIYWMNDADRWAEGIPTLVTAYTVKALKRIHASL